GGVGLGVLGEERVLREQTTQIITEQIVRRIRDGFSPEESRTGEDGRFQELQKLMLYKDLISRPDVVFTPHIAFNTFEAIERINAATVDNIRAFRAVPPVNLVG